MKHCIKYAGSASILIFIIVIAGVLGFSVLANFVPFLIWKYVVLAIWKAGPAISFWQMYFLGIILSIVGRTVFHHPTK